VADAAAAVQAYECCTNVGSYGAHRGLSAEVKREREKREYKKEGNECKWEEESATSAAATSP